MVKAEFSVSLSYLSECELKRVEMQGKSCSSRMSIEPVHFQSHTMTRSRSLVPGPSQFFNVTKNRRVWYAMSHVRHLRANGDYCAWVKRLIRHVYFN